MSEGLPIGLSLGVGSIAPGEGSQVSNYFTSGTLQQTDRNTLSLSLLPVTLLLYLSFSLHVTFLLYLSFSLPVTLLLYVTGGPGGTLQQTGRNTLSLSLLPVTLLLYLSFSLLVTFLLYLSFSLPVTLLLYVTGGPGGTLQQTGKNTLSPPCHSSTVSHWWSSGGTLQQIGRNTCYPPCHSSTVSYWWNTAADRQEYLLSSLSLIYCILLVEHCSR
jgi:hypothetical protein